MNSRISIAAALSLGVFASIGCTKILGIDKDYVETSSSGTGASSSSGTGGQSSSSSSGTGGEGGRPMIPCTDATECPGKENECAHRVCEANLCGMSYAAAGTAITAQAVGDCKKIVCDGSGNLDQQNDDTDIPNDSNPCTDDVCTGGVPSHTNVASGTTCGGALSCDGNGNCTGCTNPGECPGSDSECQQRSCTNAVCAFVYTPAGTVVSAQTPGDCKKNVCNGSGQVSTVAETMDPEDDGNPCTADSCSNGSPTHTPVAAGSPCTGGVCNGGGACVECLVADTCPGQNDECQTRTCTNGHCGMSFTPTGTPVSVQAGSDCKKNVCNGAGSVTQIADDGDVQDDGNPCTTDSCSGGSPVHAPAMAGLVCGTNKMCDANGNCVGCTTNGDCPGVDNECQSRTCMGGICGFSYQPAGTPVAAQTPGDCKKNACDGAGNTVIMVDDGDVPSDGNQCTTDVCSNGTSSFPPSPAGDACGSNGYCNGQGGCGVCIPGDFKDCCGVKSAGCCYLQAKPATSADAVSIADEDPDIVCCCGGTIDCDSSGQWGPCL